MSLGTLDGFIWGFIGGAIPEIIAVVKEVKKKPARRSSDFKSIEYILTSIVMALLGGVVCAAHVDSNNSLTPLIAMNLGITGPYALGLVAAKKAPINNE